VGLTRVIENTRLYGDTYLMWLDAGSDGPEDADLARGAAPGQFLMLRCADSAPGSVSDDPLLGRPMSYHRLRSRDGNVEFSILYNVVGRGTAWLASREPGQRIFGWGPLGHGYSLRGAGQNLLLVGGGIGIAPLLWLADEALARSKSVVLVDGAASAEGIFPAHLVPSEVEVVVTTEDGSLGRQGRVTDVFLEFYSWADQVYLCGPNAMFAAIAEVLRAAEGSQRARRRKPVQALLESPMGCGTGICYGCAVFDRRGEPRLVCKDGPRFELRDIY
jgi:dihydroorotate dehydrogenase electron transfer subunit